MLHAFSTGLVSLASAGSVCLGRKLATCFYDVNSFAEIFSPGCRRSALGARRRARRNFPRGVADVFATRKYLPRFTLFSFAMQSCARVAAAVANARQRVRSGVSRRGRARSRGGGENPARTVEMRKTAQTFPAFVPVSPTALRDLPDTRRGFRADKKEPAARGGRQLRIDGTRARISGLPRPAVRRSRPGTAAPRAGRHRPAARRTASLRHRRLR